jgi:hypothetical protein
VPFPLFFLSMSFLINDRLWDHTGRGYPAQLEAQLDAYDCHQRQQFGSEFVGISDRLKEALAKWADQKKSYEKIRRQTDPVDNYAEIKRSMQYTLPRLNPRSHEYLYMASGLQLCDDLMYEITRPDSVLEDTTAFKDTVAKELTNMAPLVHVEYDQWLKSVQTSIQSALIAIVDNAVAHIYVPDKATRLLSNIPNDPKDPNFNSVPELVECFVTECRKYAQ